MSSFLFQLSICLDLQDCAVYHVWRAIGMVRFSISYHFVIFSILFIAFSAHNLADNASCAPLCTPRYLEDGIVITYNRWYVAIYDIYCVMNSQLRGCTILLYPSTCIFVLTNLCSPVSGIMWAHHTPPRVLSLRRILRPHFRYVLLCAFFIFTC